MWKKKEAGFEGSFAYGFIAAFACRNICVQRRLYLSKVSVHYVKTLYVKASVCKCQCVCVDLGQVSF